MIVTPATKNALHQIIYAAYVVFMVSPSGLSGRRNRTKCGLSSIAGIGDSPQRMTAPRPKCPKFTLQHR